METRKETPLLIIDDERGIRTILTRYFEEHGYPCTATASAEEALDLVERNRFTVSLTDIKLEGMSGLDYLDQVRRKDPFLSVVMMTGVNDVDIAVRAMRKGATDYITKPFQLREVALNVEQAIEQRRLRMENEEYRRYLEDKVEERTGELRRAIVEIGSTYATTLESLCNALDIRDNETEGHSQRVSTFAVTVAREMDFSDDNMLDVERGSLLHDIGKIGIPDSILRKTGPLTKDEWQIMQQHPVLGYKMLRHIKFLEGPRRVVLEHHERWDGKGYPQGIQGEDICLGARIFAVADTFDAITSDRRYRGAQTFEVAEEEIRNGAGKQFDPEVVEAFLAITKDKWEIVRRMVKATLRHVLDESDAPWYEEFGRPGGEREVSAG